MRAASFPSQVQTLLERPELTQGSADTGAPTLSQLKVTFLAAAP